MSSGNDVVGRIRTILETDGAGYVVNINLAANAVKGLDTAADKAQFSVGSLSSILGGAALAAGASALAAGVAKFGVESIKLAATAEQNLVSFTTMLGSAEKAKELAAEINSFAAATPFNTTDLVTAAKSLLAFGTAQDQIIPTMRVLGDLSAGLNIPIKDLSDLYGKAQVQGRLMMEDINQLTGRGIPVIQEFAKQFGVGEEEVRKLVEQGKIGFPQLQSALVSLTGDGGKFTGLMAAQSQTLAGVWSTMGDTVEQAMVRIGAALVEELDLNDVVTDVGLSLQALADHAIPALAAMLEGWTGNADVAGMAGEAVLVAAEWIAKGIGYAIGALELLGAGWELLKAGVLFWGASTVNQVDLVGKALVALANLIPGVSFEWTNAFEDISRSMKNAANDALGEAGRLWDSAGKDRAGDIDRFFDDVRKTVAASKKAADDAAKTPAPLKIQQAITGLDPKLVKESLDAVGKIEVGTALDSYAAKLEKLNDLLRAGKIAAKDFDAGRKSAIKSLNESLDKAAKDVLDDIKTPLDKYREQTETLQALLATGRLDQSQFDKAMDRAAGELLPKSASVSGVSAGSREGANLIAQFRNDAVATRLPDLVGKTNEKLAEQLLELTEIKKNTANAVPLGRAPSIPGRIR